MIKEFAICFSGQTRQMYKGYEDFKILFKDQEFDIFAHIWDAKELLSTWGHNMGWENKQTPVNSPQEFIDTYNPKKVNIEDYTKTPFYNQNISNLGYRNTVNKIYSSLSQFYSMMKSFDVWQEYEKESGDTYKYAVRYRSDLDFEEKTTPDWDNIKKRLDENPKLILVNNGWDWPNGMGCANHFAVGSHDAMKIYALLYESYIEIFNINPHNNYDEAIMKMYLEQKCGLKVEHCDINMGMYR